MLKLNLSDGSCGLLGENSSFLFPPNPANPALQSTTANTRMHPHLNLLAGVDCSRAR